MYIGTQAFKTANARPIQKHRIRGTIDDIPFTGANILSGSLTITNQCSEDTDFKIGAVYIGEMSVTFLRNLSVTPTSWNGRKISVYFSLCIDEEHDTFEEFKVGEWYVSEASINADGVSVNCYDAMSKLEKQLPTDYLASGSIASIARSLCNTCGVVFGMTDAQVAALPNGDHTLGLWTPNEASTYRDLIYYLSNVVGGFATINRDGQLVFRTYSNRAASEFEITANRRVTGASFSDFSIDFDSMIFENADGTTQKLGSSAGPEYYNGFNPFMEYGTGSERTTIRQNVADVVSALEYTPYYVEIMSAPIFELGDVLEFTGGIVSGLDKVGIVQAVSWTMGGSQVIHGFGSDPAIQDVKTTQEMADSSTRRSNNASEVVYKDYVNISPITVTSEQVKVTDINFTTNKETEIEMWHEIQVNTTKTGESMELEAVYYLDGEEQLRHPVETYSDDGYHILDLHYYTPVNEIGSHRWEVYLEATGGTATIRANDAIAVLKGQGISKADGWTGVIILDDEVGYVPFEFGVEAFGESLDVNTHPNDTSELSDNITITPFGYPPEELTDTVNVFLYIPHVELISEDGVYNITDESEEFNIESQY